MVKTTFEGVVNGQVYSTVEEYNEAVNKALAANVPLEAHTNTRVELVKDESKPLVQRVERHAVDFHNLGGFNFLPDVCLDDMTEEGADEFQDMLKKLYENANQLDACTDEELTRFLNEIKMLNNKNRQREDVTDRAIKAVEDNIKSYKEKLDTLYRSSDIITHLGSYYEDIVDTVNEELMSRRNRNNNSKRPSRLSSHDDRVHQLLKSIGLA